MVIALLTDFGTRDPYVAAMKGVLAGRTAVPVVDLTHEIAPFDVFEAAWFLRAVVDYWPEGTVFVCVVDPGVGSERRIVALEDRGRVFLAPDNGLLAFVAGVAHQVTDESHFLPDGSTTFHGRDRFAPLAAAIANGLAIETLGPRIDDLVRLPNEPGTIVHIDRFGNAITNIEWSAALGGAVVNGVTIDRIEQNYASAAPGPFLIIGSTGCVEISVANASAAELLHLHRGDRVETWPKNRK
jgi:S-adenosylmethionine hydrolase